MYTYDDILHHQKRIAIFSSVYIQIKFPHVRFSYDIGLLITNKKSSCVLSLIMQMFVIPYFQIQNL